MQRVLLADDSVAARRSIQQMLEMAGIEVVAVGNGDLALSRISEVAPHMILLDVVMPGRSGYEICEAIKNDSSHSGLPVMLVTSDFEPYDADEAERVGADGHLIKPLDSHAIGQMRDVWSAYSPDEMAKTAEPPSLLPAPEFTPRVVSSVADGSSTDGIDAYSTVAMQMPQFSLAPVPLVEGIASGTMVVGLPPWPSAVAPGVEPAAPPPVEEPEVRRGKTAPLPDIAIDSLDEESPVEELDTDERPVSAPTTENLDPSLVEESEIVVRTASEAGIRQAGSAELKLAADRCPVCSAALSSGDIFCIACGAAVLSGGESSPVYEDAPIGGRCECGHPLIPGDIFCVECGAAV